MKRSYGLMKCPIWNCVCVDNIVGFYQCYYNNYVVKNNKDYKKNENYDKKSRISKILLQIKKRL